MPAHRHHRCGRRHRRHRSARFGDRGAVTVEAALALTAFVLVLAMALGGAMAMADQVRCVDAAREAARLTARGDEQAARSAAERIAPKNAEVMITVTEDHVEVQVRATPAGGLLPGVHLRAKAFAVREPEG